MQKFSKRANVYYCREFQNGEALKYLGNEEGTCWLYARYKEDWKAAHMPVYFEPVPEDAELATEGSQAYIFENQHSDFYNKKFDSWISFKDGNQN